MSSFIINKSEYIKAAGLMYGLESAKNCPHKWFLDNVKSWFTLAYELNVASVNEQYHDNCPTDKDDYYSTFQTYCKKGEQIYISSIVGNDSEFKSFSICMMNFFDSVLYQIENQQMNDEVSAIFYKFIKKLFQSDTSKVDGWWGNIEC